jgi:hypothetical protein
LLATDAGAARLFDPAARAAALAATDTAALADWCRAVQQVTNDDVTVLAIRVPSARPA